MDALSWIALVIAVLAIAAVPALIGIRTRMLSALAKERRAREEALEALEQEKRACQERIQSARLSGRRAALDEFVRELRVEERTRVREANSMFSARRIVVYEERLCFGDQPLSNWVEQEVRVEEETESAPKPASVFLPTPGRYPAPADVNHSAPVTS